MSWRVQRKDLRERGSLTSRRMQMDGLIRTWKESEGARGTHVKAAAGLGYSV